MELPVRSVYIPHFDQISLKICVLGVLYAYRCCSSITNTLPQSRPTVCRVVLGTWKNPCAEIGKKIHRRTHAESDSRLLFQKQSKSVQDKWPKGRVAFLTKEKKAPWSEPSRDFPHFSCVSAHHGPSLTFQIALTQVPVWGSYNRKTCPGGPK